MGSDDSRVRRSRDVLRTDRIAALAATLGVECPRGGSIPPLWHWLMFQTWRPPAELGRDGHPGSDPFLPLSPELPRRMAAGFTLEFHAELPADEEIERTSVVIADEAKSGRSGPLRFVTVEHRYAARGAVCVRELQHIVYRPPLQGAEAPGPVAQAAPPLAVVQTVNVESVLLFRYSALAGIGHRIHYDADYARDVEGYPGLVIHGPLQAILLAGLATSGAFGRRELAGLSVRSVHPAFTTTAPLTVEGEAVQGGVRLQTRDRAGVACTTAQGTWR